MITLTIDNSISRIEGLGIIDFKKLRKILSYTDNPQAAYFSGNRNTIRYLLNKKGEFPSGVLFLVEEFLKDILYECLDKRKIPIKQKGLFSLSLPFTPYADQKKAAHTCVSKHRGIVSAVTGFGKSVTMALLVEQLQVPTLIIVPNLELKTQLTESFIQYFGDLKHITIENIDSNSLHIQKNYGCIIIDEAHHSAAKTYRKLNETAWKGIYYRYFFTATPFRSQKEEQLLFESIAGQVIYEVSYHTAVKNKQIVPIEAFYVEVPKSPIRGNTWASVYKDLVVHNKERNILLHELLVKLHANNLSTLCLVKEIRHGEILTYGGSFNFITGDNEHNKVILNLFNSRKINCLIGTTGVLGEGVDTKPAEYIIIAGLGKSKNSIMQQIGRGLRNYQDKETCKIIIFKDLSHKWSKAHFVEQVKILKEEYGVTPVKLEV